MNNRTDVLVDYVPNYCWGRVLILGCGNVLFGEDGFGPAVIEHLTENYALPDEVCALDVGTGVRDLLCTVALSPIKPERIVVIDAVDRGSQPGEMFVGPIEAIPSVKGGIPPLHHLPTSSLLKELRDYCQLDIRLISAQPLSIPEVVAPRLSRELQEALASVCDYIVMKCI